MLIMDGRADFRFQMVLPRLVAGLLLAIATKGFGAWQSPFGPGVVYRVELEPVIRWGECRFVWVWRCLCG